MVWWNRQSVGGFEAEDCRYFIDVKSALWKLHTPEEADTRVLRMIENDKKRREDDDGHAP